MSEIFDPTHNADFSSRLDAVVDYVKTLPQAMMIDPEDCIDWVRKVSLLTDNHAPIWHARRLRGIGSSEIGACVTSMRGGYSPFLSARDVVKSKLMKLAPDDGSGHTRRGNALEPMIRDMFHAQFKTRSEDAMMNAMLDFKVKDAPWMVGNPDDLCVIGGKLYIVDYKAPSPDVFADYQKEDGVNFDYVCQLHHLQHIGRTNGLPIEGRLLCSLNMMEWSLDVRTVDYDPALLSEMIDVGNTLWNDYIMTGTVPAPIIQEKFTDIDEADAFALHQLTKKLVVLKTVQGQSYDMVKRITDEVTRISEKYRIENKKVPSFCSSVKADELLDTEILSALAQRHGLPVPDFKDEEALLETIEALEAKGEPRTRYVVEKHKFSMSRPKSGPVFDTLEAIKEEVATLIESHVEDYVAKGQADEHLAILEAAKDKPETKRKKKATAPA